MKTQTCIFAISLAAGLISSRAQDTWTRKADFGGTARYGVVGFSIGSKGYMGTGDLDPNFYKDFWEYDPALDTWTQKADFGGGIRAHTASFTIGNKGYVGTGQAAVNSYTNDLWEYDPTTNTWTQKANFGGASRFG